MRKLTLAIAALLTCATLPLRWRSPHGAGAATAAPPAAQPAAAESGRHAAQQGEAPPPVPPVRQTASPQPGRPLHLQSRRRRLSASRQADRAGRLLQSACGRLGLPGGAGRPRRAGEGDRAPARTRSPGSKAQVALIARAAAAASAGRLDAAAAGPAAADGRQRSGPRRQDSAKLREDLERARLAFENAWRRLVEMIVNLQKDMMRKS